MGPVASIDAPARLQPFPSTYDLSPNIRVIAIDAISAWACQQDQSQGTPSRAITAMIESHQRPGARR
jgi:hypothetical protein